MQHKKALAKVYFLFEMDKSDDEIRKLSTDEFRQYLEDVVEKTSTIMMTKAKEGKTDFKTAIRSGIIDTLRYEAIRT